MINKLIDWWRSFKEWYRLKKKRKADWYEFFPTVDDFKQKVVKDRQEEDASEEAKRKYMEWVQNFHERVRQRQNDN